MDVAGGTIVSPRLLAAVLAAALFSAACVVQSGSDTATADPSAPGEIPFTLAGTGGAAVVVEGRLNGRGPYRFVVDTGATLTCVDDGLAEELALPTVPGVIGHGATIGRAGAVTLRRLESIELGNAKATDLTVCVLDLANLAGAGLHVDGLVGLNVLRAYTVTFDFKRNILSLEP